MAVHWHYLNHVFFIRIIYSKLIKYETWKWNTFLSGKIICLLHIYQYIWILIYLYLFICVECLEYRMKSYRLCLRRSTRRIIYPLSNSENVTQQLCRSRHTLHTCSYVLTVFVQIWRTPYNSIFFIVLG